MTYILTKDPELRAKLIRENREYEESLLRPIDWDDPQVQKNMAKFRAMTKPIGCEPDNSTWERLDAKINMSTQEFLEDIWDNQGISAPIEIPEEKPERPMTKREKMKFRPCVGCPDCRHFKNFECTNPNPKPEICDWISERYMEKAE